jgi:hypothetical protein
MGSEFISRKAAKAQRRESRLNSEGNSWLSGFLLKTIGLVFKKEAMNPREMGMTSSESPTTKYKLPTTAWLQYFTEQP